MVFWGSGRNYFLGADKRIEPLPLHHVQRWPTWITNFIKLVSTNFIKLVSTVWLAIMVVSAAPQPPRGAIHAENRAVCAVP